MVANTEDITVLVVDDTAFYRNVLRRCVAELPHARVIGTAATGREALTKIEQLQPDFVILDIEMPELNGLATLRQVHRRWPEVGVVIVSGQDRNSAELTVEALARGAIDFVAKGGGGNPDENLHQLRSGLRRVIDTYRASRFRRRTRPEPASPDVALVTKDAATTSTGRAKAERIDVIAIAASTGGPQVLSTVIPMLPATLGVPVLIVQHMLPAFTVALARSLDRISPLRVCEASEGQTLEPGNVYVAPGARHMVVRAGSPGLGGARASIGLTDSLPENGCRPSADVLFRSLAAFYQGQVLAAVMTGMGIDGAAGVRALKKRGATCLTQSADSCVVYGMPRAVVEAGLSDANLAPEALALRIVEVAQRSS